jgi:hypothetical protein
MKNIHVLPTDKPSRLIIYNSKLELVNYPVITPSKNQQNINITSDEKFVRGEWITDGIEVIKATPKLVDAQGLVDRRDWRKIILTTDQDLINNGVQAIDDDFLEWFVKNSSCERVLYRRLSSGYKIIIPQQYNNLNYGGGFTEEDIKRVATKQETLEQVAERILANNIDGLRDALKDDDLFFFYKGVVQCYGEAMAKWQAERMYSEEDLKLLIEYTRRFSSHSDSWILKEWFEQFKKK